jgi:hypothetical protein
MFVDLMHACEVINKVRFVNESTNHNSTVQHKVGFCDVQIGCHQPKVDNANIPSPLFNPLGSMGPAHAQLGFNSTREVLSTYSQFGNLVLKVGKPRDKEDALNSLTKKLW